VAEAHSQGTVHKQASAAGFVDVEEDDGREYNE
jgi:hypothetical protein